MNFDRARVAVAVTELARSGVFIGASGWRYPGWRGLLYDDSRYHSRGRFAERRFEKECLIEYGEVFRTVCVDATYYKFPDTGSLEELAGQVPSDFQFAFKVTDEITVRRWPELPRFGDRAGRLNPNFLNADLCAEAFLARCEVCRPQVGALIFEFSKLHPPDQDPDLFLQNLDNFLGTLTRGWPCAVEVRNPEYLRPEYFALLQKHGVAHVYNSWGDMPSLAEQIALPDAETHPRLSVARLLLKPGRRFETAVKLFAPYRETRDLNPAVRQAAASLLKKALAGPRDRRTFLFVNNRLEGNSLNTIMGIIEQSISLPASPPPEKVRFIGNQANMTFE